MRRRALVLGLAVALASACEGGDGGGGDGSVAGSSTSSVSVPLLTTVPAPSTTTAGQVTYTFTVTDLRLTNSEESDNGFRILLNTTAPDVGVTLTGVPSPNHVIRVCPAAELERRTTGPGSACQTPSSGQEVRMPLAATSKGVEIVQVGVSSGGPSGNTTALSEISLRFAGTSREIRMRLPPLAAGESGGRPSFRLSPPVGGAYRAGITWAPPTGNTGTVEMALTMGTTTATRAEGGPGTELSGILPQPVEAQLRVRNTGSTTVLGATIIASLP